MFLKVKRLQPIESLLLETDLIQLSGEAGDILNREKANKQDSGQTGSDKKQSGPSNEEINELLDKLFNLGEDDLNSRMDDPEFASIFSDPSMKAILDKYFIYLRQNLQTFKSELLKALRETPINEVKVKSITDKITKFVCRVRVIEIIYQKKAAKKRPADFSDFSEEIYKACKNINDELYKIYSFTITEPAEKTKQAYSKFQGAQSQDDKAAAALEIYSSIQAADILSEEMPDEVKTGIHIASEEYERRIESELGKAIADEIKAGIYVNKNVASLIRRIFEFQYTNWTNENDITVEANKLKTSINGFPDVSEDAKEYLRRLVNQIESQLIGRAKSKEFNTKKYKGIHYDFEKAMPLYERTLLPVTGKQIADDTRVMKFRKASQEIMGLVFGASTTAQDSITAQAFAKTGAWAHTLYAKTLNGAAMVIGKAVKGREGEMKADAFTRLFILDTSVVDKPKTKPISEDSMAPGVSPQVPGSISGMGQITPPTENSIGSGDNFGITKKKKKNPVLDFHNFLKENSIRK